MSSDYSMLFRIIPSVERILSDPDVDRVLAGYPRPVVVEGVRLALDRVRERIRLGNAPDEEKLAASAFYIPMIEKEVRLLLSPSLRRVINATGIVIHTNLGRSPLPAWAFDRARDTALGYSNLEFDLESGTRGSRYVHAESLLCRLTGAEAALVVNNNAAAVLVALHALAFDREVIVSRGELIEIGGSFRLPDIMKAGGAKLVEVGTTNRTHEDDYRRAIGDRTALLMKVHLSNFRVEGYTATVSPREIARIGEEKGIPLLYDLGSGAFADLGKGAEPTVFEELRGGADVLTLSGDKLLGSVQAGILVGGCEILERIRRTPMMRAVRVDKVTLALLEATLTAYLDPETVGERVPVLRLISRPLRDIRKDVEELRGSILAAAGDGTVEADIVEGESEAGGGAIGHPPIATWLLSLSFANLRPEAAATLLRAHDPPIIVRIRQERVLVDPRTLFPEEIPIVATAIAGAASTPRDGESVEER